VLCTFESDTHELPDHQHHNRNQVKAD